MLKKYCNANQDKITIFLPKSQKNLYYFCLSHFAIESKYIKLFTSKITLVIFDIISLMYFCQTFVTIGHFTKLDGSLPANPVNDRHVTSAVTLKSTFGLP